MTLYKYKDIVANARTIKKQVESDYDFTLTPNWVYYFCKALIKPKTDINGFGIAKPSKPTGDHISRQIKKADYLDMCKRIVAYVEKNKRIPNYVTYKNIRVNIRLWCYVSAYLLVHYVDDKALKTAVNVNSKYFIKPTENKNTVFTKWINTFKFTPKYIDDVCDYILKHFTYLFYYDDEKSNAEVISSKSGNCTDLLQMLVNMAEALGYEWKVYHVSCNQSGTGHVYGMFRKAGVNNGNWFIRDIACIADESRYCVWCEAGNGGSLIAVNPSWFLSNLRR